MSTILVVEDSKFDMEILSQYLIQAGHDVIKAQNSQEAQNAIKNIKPDVIFLDIILPEKSGYEICREFKQNLETKEIPIVFCSIKSTKVDRSWGEMLGAEAYIGKPINKEEVLSALKEVIAY